MVLWFLNVLIVSDVLNSLLSLAHMIGQTRTSHMDGLIALLSNHKYQHTHPFFLTSLIQYLSIGFLILNLMQLFFWISSTAA